MRKFLALTLIVAFGLIITGCGKELNDENFVEFWIKSYNIENEEEAQKVADEYGWSQEDMDNYYDELADDPDRAEKVVDMVAEKDEDAAFVLAMSLGLGGAMAEFEDLEAFGEEFSAGMEELGQGLGDLFGGMVEGMEGMAEGIDESLAGLGGLTDKELAEIFVAAYPEEEVPAEVLEKYETDDETVEEAFEALEEDPERVKSVSEKIHSLDEEKGAAFDEIFM